MVFASFFREADEMIIDAQLSARLKVLGVLIAPLEGRAEVHPDAEFEPPCVFLGGFDGRYPIKVGAYSYSYSPTGPFIWEIGRYCSIGGAVRFGDMEHPPEWLSTSNFTYDREFWAQFPGHNGFPTAPLPAVHKRTGGITIGHDVWIGAASYVRVGVTVGAGAIVGHSAVVTKDVPPYAIVVGNPARIIKYRFPEALIERLLASEWWKYRYTDFAGMDFTKPEVFLEQLAARELQEYRPDKIRLSDVRTPPLPG
jgi:acetyltransferase-like isoleucine patch superfamily enzyme